MPLHKSVVEITTITISKQEVEQAILDYLKLSHANEIKMESDGRANVIIRKHVEG